jgi:E3 ubiquitin-protein ligase HUWE1
MVPCFIQRDLQPRLLSVQAIVQTKSNVPGKKSNQIVPHPPNRCVRKKSLITDFFYIIFLFVCVLIPLQPEPRSYVNPEHLNYFHFVGRIIGKAIYDGHLMDAYFTRSLYKHILGVPLKIEDMEAIDAGFYNSLKWILENDIDGIIEETFSTEVDEFGKTKVRQFDPLIPSSSSFLSSLTFLTHSPLLSFSLQFQFFLSDIFPPPPLVFHVFVVQTVPLMLNGESILVTNENKKEYVRLICEQRMATAIQTQIEYFLKGFFEIIPRSLIRVFNENELELLISGLPDVDLEDLRANTDYVGYTPSSPQIQWFWRVCTEMDQVFIAFVRHLYLVSCCECELLPERTCKFALLVTGGEGSIFAVRHWNQQSPA